MLVAALRIVADVAAYRLRRFEMANLGATVALLVALHAKAADVFARVSLAALLNLFSYVNNDAVDVDRDLQAGRATEKTQFLAEHRGAALAAQLGLLALVAALALAYRPATLVSVALGAGLCALYSVWLKRVPLLDVLAMAAWGVAMTSLAVPPSSRVGWALAVQLGLFSAVFECIQVLRDHDADRAAGVTTTAVFLGPARTLALARGLIVLSAAYGALVVHRGFGALQLVAAALPASTTASARYWGQVRLVLSLCFLGMLAVVFREAALPFE